MTLLITHPFSKHNKGVLTADSLVKPCSKMMLMATNRCIIGNLRFYDDLIGNPLT
jgi:hypothetical protein